MPKSRAITRKNRRREQSLDRKNEFGHTDLTPYEAVKQMRKQTQKTGTTTSA